MGENRFPDAPARIRALRCDARGYPVPWFIAWIGDEPDFRVIARGRIAEAVRGDRCWICGERMGRFRAYVIGPMCAVNRVSSEPPSHVECAQFAARACPFLTQPRRIRNADGPAGDLADAKSVGGVGILRNPGASLLWIVTRPARPHRDGQGGILFDVGDPERVEWWAHGRAATRAEVEESITSGLPELQRLADRQGKRAQDELERRKAQAWRLLPAA